MRRLFLVLALAASGFAFAGCPASEPGHMSAGLSLVEIGERSLESAERFETAGDFREADISYRRALWAFRYHERLTGEQPLLMDEAVSGARRLVPAKR